MLMPQPDGMWCEPDLGGSTEVELQHIPAEDVELTPVDSWRLWRTG